MTPTRAEPLRTSGDRAHAAILAGIIDGTYPAGMMLSENELAAEIGVSRTPVRAALARLQDDGWLTIYPKRGALVRAPTVDEVADMADARLVLESSGVRRATPEERRDLADRLEASMQRQKAALAERDVSSFIEVTFAFHRSFVEAGGNRYFIELCDHLADRQRQLLFTRRDLLLERSEEILAEHRELLRHLRDSDAEGFTAILRAHLTEAQDHRLAI